MSKELSMSTSTNTAASQPSTLLAKGGEPTLDVIPHALSAGSDGCSWRLSPDLDIDGIDLRAGDRAIWSVGDHPEHGRWAATDDRFYGPGDWSCVWLR